jgi:hypothetical protein
MMATTKRKGKQWTINQKQLAHAEVMSGVKTNNKQNKKE